MSSEGVRRSARILKEVAILLIGSDIDGRVFSEKTNTVVLSRHGAGIVSGYKLSPEQELIVRCVLSNKETEVRVVGQIGEHQKGYTYGVAFLDAPVNFWGEDLPALSEAGEQADGAWLECRSCKRHEKALHGDLEADVCAINEGLVRYCKNCGSSTLWKQVEGEYEEPETLVVASDTLAPSIPAHPATRASEQFQTVAETSVATVSPENRRKHRRTKVNFAACVRRASSDEDDIVTCEDMSRGGLRFKSKKQYYEQVMIEVAVPYSPGSQSIFVPGKIVFVQELPEQKLFRCGVAYTRSA